MIPWLKFLPYIAGVLFVFGCGTYLYHKGDEHGAARIQVRFDKFVAASDKAAAAQLAQNAADKSKAESNNAQVITRLSGERDSAVADRNVFAGRLRAAIAQASSSPVPQGTDQPGTAPEGQPPSLSALADAIADARTECIDNDNRFDALIDELTPQL